MCLYPRLMENPRYKPNKKNGGVIPPFHDQRILIVPVKCGHCMECRKQKAREWQVRLLEDIKHNKNGKFITLTFSNESIKQINDQIPKTYKDKKGNDIPLEGYKRDNAIATYAVRHWLERWRKKYGVSLRHWLITELGHKGTENIHLHGIVWTDNLQDIRPTWAYGFVWDGYTVNEKKQNYVSSRTVNYIVKYVNKIDHKHRYYKQLTLSSPGIGAAYDGTKNKYFAELTDETYRTPTGHKIAMPTYWRNKIYTDEQKEQLWINKIDKQERYINGEKIDVTNGVEEYYKLLQWHRQRNIELGYGDDMKNWKKEEYENKRRIHLLHKRTSEIQAEATTAQTLSDNTATPIRSS